MTSMSSGHRETTRESRDGRELEESRERARPRRQASDTQQDTVGLAAGRSPARAAGDRERTRRWSSI